ncbi:TPA: NAD-dependent malic enzyme [Candidatus Beckwithbacteria bacterium]|nr:NAD-dependent malic enzyme [Candidatus Beckwithbacteria bacterium]
MKNSPALAYSQKPKLAVKILAPLKSKRDLSLAYTPGIAEVAKAVAADGNKLYTYTFKRNNLAVISDGSAVLGLGNIGHKGSYPVMEGKAMLFRRFGRINAVPIIVKTQKVDEFVDTVVNIADSFGAINLEDISAPRCFEIEERLKKLLDIPLMHDDQHGTAIVVLSALTNALKLLPKSGKNTRIVMVGSGSAGVAVSRLLVMAGYKNIILCDSKGIVSKRRRDLNPVKRAMLKVTNPNNVSGKIQDALKGAQGLIGVSRAGLVGPADIKLMDKAPIIFAMANPVPEITPEEAKRGGAYVIGTGRSDYPNQINNSLAFPGIFRGALDRRVRQITDEMKVKAAKNLAALVKRPTAGKIIPGPFDKGVTAAVARAVK